MLWDFVLWDSVLWDFVRRDFVLWDFVLWDSVPDSLLTHQDWPTFGCGKCWGRVICWLEDPPQYWCHAEEIKVQTHELR